MQCNTVCWMVEVGLMKSVSECSMKLKLMICCWSSILLRFEHES
jgi:hypothetical protein